MFRHIRSWALGVGVVVLALGAAPRATAFFPQSQPPFPPVGVEPQPPIIVPDPPPPPPPPPVRNTPEPGTMLLGAVGAGIAGLAARRRRS